jgi:hypothetical protein
LVVALVISVAWSQEEAKDKETGERPSVYQRLIPADVLRGKKAEGIGRQGLWKLLTPKLN